jgi:hypothetical protein
MLNEKRNDIPLDLWVVKIDQTEYWTKEVFKENPCIKRIFGVYMVDMNSRTFCCELTPSYALCFLENQWDGDSPDDDEALEKASESMQEPEDQRFSYYHCSTIDRTEVCLTNFSSENTGFPKGRMGRYFWGAITLEEDDDRDKVFDEACQSFFENPL